LAKPREGQRRPRRHAARERDRQVGKHQQSHEGRRPRTLRQREGQAKRLRGLPPVHLARRDHQCSAHARVLPGASGGPPAAGGQVPGRGQRQRLPHLRLRALGRGSRRSGGGSAGAREGHRNRAHPRTPGVERAERDERSEDGPATGQRGLNTCTGEPASQPCMHACLLHSRIKGRNNKGPAQLFPDPLLLRSRCL